MQFTLIMVIDVEPSFHRCHVIILSGFMAPGPQYDVAPGRTVGIPPIPDLCNLMWCGIRTHRHSGTGR